ncbi:MAG: hypothetical protein EOM16_01255 [Bacteroidia bacterium]|jgi:hypothetical protein|nr:hypothetical protein [Bacteroidia bacterium]
MENKLSGNPLLEVVGSLFEKSVFISQSFNSNVLSCWCGCSLEELDNLLEKEYGYDSGQIIALHRAQHARFLLKNGVEYELLYKFSGFSSKKEMEMALDYIAV